VRPVRSADCFGPSTLRIDGHAELVGDRRPRLTARPPNTHVIDIDRDRRQAVPSGPTTASNNHVRITADEILQPPATALARRRTPDPQPSKADTGRPATATSRQRSSGRRELGERSSANLPIDLVEQLAQCKHRHRRELSQLIDSALEHLGPSPDVVDADAVLYEHWCGLAPHGTTNSSIECWSVSKRWRERWRMNRSKTITVVVIIEAQRLGLTA